MRSLLLGCLGFGLGGTCGVVLILQEFSDFVSNKLSAFVGTGSLTCETDGFLLLDGVAGLEVLHHLALEGRESSDFHHDVTDGSDSGVKSALAVRLVCLESIWVLLGLSHDVALVQTDKNS